MFTSLPSDEHNGQYKHGLSGTFIKKKKKKVKDHSVLNIKPWEMGLGAGGGGCV